MTRQYPLRSPFVEAVAGMSLEPFLAIPRAFFHHPALRNGSGKPNLVAIEVLSMLLAWYRPLWVEEVGPDGQPQLRAYQRFPGIVLRVNYAAWARWLFGDETKIRPIKRAVTFLKNRGLVDVQVHSRQNAEGRLAGAAVYVAPRVDALRAILDVRNYAAAPEDLFLPAESPADPADEEPTPTPLPLPMFDDDTPRTDADEAFDPAPTYQKWRAGAGEDEPSRRFRRDGSAPGPPPTHQKWRVGEADGPSTPPEGPTDAPKSGASVAQDPAPTHQKVATDAPKTGHRRAKKWRAINKESLRAKNPTNKQDPTLPPAGEGGVGGGGEPSGDGTGSSPERAWERVLRRAGVTQAHRQAILQRLANGEIAVGDIPAALAYAYAGRQEGRVRHPARLAGALLARGDLPPAEYLDPDVWRRYLPPALWDALPGDVRTANRGSRAPVDADARLSLEDDEPGPQEAALPGDPRGDDEPPSQPPDAADDDQGEFVWQTLRHQLRAYLGPGASDQLGLHLAQVAGWDGEVLRVRVPTPHLDHLRARLAPIARAYLRYLVPNEAARVEFVPDDAA